MALHQLAYSGIAPTRLVYAADREQAADKGSILFCHGLGSSKDQQDKELNSLAERGFLAIGIDAVGHGERRYPDFEQRFSGQNPDFGRELIQTVAASVAEIPSLIDELVGAGLVRPDKLGLIGVSMGGYIAYGAILAERRIQAAAVILGSPDWWEGAAESPHRVPQRFYPTAILSQNAGQDGSVAPQHAREFHRALEPWYTEAPERQRYIEFPESGHFMREPDWNQCWENALVWLERFVSKH